MRKENKTPSMCWHVDDEEKNEKRKISVTSLEAYGLSLTHIRACGIVDYCALMWKSIATNINIKYNAELFHFIVIFTLLYISTKIVSL